MTEVIFSSDGNDLCVSPRTVGAYVMRGGIRHDIPPQYFQIYLDACKIISMKKIPPLASIQVQRYLFSWLITIAINASDREPYWHISASQLADTAMAIAAL